MRALSFSVAAAFLGAALALWSTGAALAADAAPAAGGRVRSPLEAVATEIRDLQAHLSNATFKLKQGVGGMGSSEEAFSPQSCCAINLQRFKTAGETIAREQRDLRRDLERAGNAEGIAKLEALAAASAGFEEGRRLLAAARDRDTASATLAGLLKQLHAIEAAHADLVACCAPPER
jgi:hypothetical protein